MIRGHVLLVAALFVAVPQTGAVAQSGTSRPSWPAPPAPARIRFVRSLSPASVRGRPSLLSRVVRVVTGGGVDPTMSQPYGIAVGRDRRVYVADTLGGTIHIYNPDKSDYSTIKVNAESLIGIALVGTRIVVTDSTSGRVLCLDDRGRTVWTLGPRNGFERPTGIVAATDRLYVVDTLKNQVVMVSTAGAVLGTFGSRGAEPGQFNYPTNIARSADGRLYVTDTLNFRVQVFDANGRPLSVFGRLGDGSGDFDKPKGIAVDSAGHIYVVEGLNDVVQIFDEGGRLLLAFGGSGVGDGQLWLPSGIAIANDVVYVADSANRRVQMFEYLKEPR
jgi:DNA-binding beta-propeller fold protein YncE